MKPFAKNLPALPPCAAESLGAAHLSQLFQMSPSETVLGICAVCNHPTIMAFKDVSTGFRLCRACTPMVLRAEYALRATQGLRHPTPAESLSLPNH